MSERRGPRRANVLIGSAVFLLVVGSLVLLAFQARVSANRMKCEANLKQLALAVHNYHESMNRLPPIVDQGDRAVTGRGVMSGYAVLIPYIESTPGLYFPGETPDINYHGHSSVAFTYQHKDGTPGTKYGGVANQAWRVFIDPGDGTAENLRDVPMTLPDGTTGYYATGSYVTNGLLPWGKKSLLNPPLVLISERPQVCRTADGEAVYNLWGLGFYSPHMPAFAALAPPGLGSTGQVAPAADGAVRIGRLDAVPESPDFLTPLRRAREPCDPRLPSGPHRAGLLAAMTDGSVRVFGWDTDPAVFWAACLPPQED